MGDGTIAFCVWGAVGFAFATRFANAWARDGDVFIVQGESLGMSYLYHRWRPFIFVVGTEDLVTLLNVHASLGSFGNMLPHLCVYTRLVLGMFRLAWRLLRVWLLNYAWPICLGIIRAWAAVAFAICDMASAIPFHELGGTRRYFLFCVAAVFILDLFPYSLAALVSGVTRCL